MMHSTKTIRNGLAVILLGLAVGNDGSIATTHAQQSEDAKPAAKKRVREGGRDPFLRYQAPRITVKRVAGIVMTSSIQDRISQYKAHKLAAMNARMAAPKPTTALLLSEMQVVGISRTPRGYAAIVEATPIKLSYVIYPGERFYDGQLVAIEDNRLVFRREIVLSDGRRERSVEIKPLRQANTVNLMTTAKTVPDGSTVADSAKGSEQPAAATRPE
jgi:hypothetical protein